MPILFALTKIKTNESVRENVCTSGKNSLDEKTNWIIRDAYDRNLIRRSDEIFKPCWFCSFEDDENDDGRVNRFSVHFLQFRRDKMKFDANINKKRKRCIVIFCVEGRILKREFKISFYRSTKQLFYYFLVFHFRFDADLVDMLKTRQQLQVKQLDGETKRARFFYRFMIC